jgi:integrase
MSLDPATVDALRQHLARQAQHRLAIGPAGPSRQSDWRGEYRDDPIFTWPDGTIISPDRYTEWFARHRKAAGLRRIRLHDLRHTYATVGLRNATGWHEVKVISQRLGHTSIGFTLDTYAHVLPAADEQTAHTLAQHILGEIAS